MPVARLAAPIILWLVAVANATDEPFLKIRMEGHAEGVGFAARHTAIEDAQREALRSLLSNYVPSGNLEPLAPMLQAAPSYVDHYDILRHDTVEEETWVELDCFIDEKKVNYDLAATMLPRLPKKPEVLLLIGEKLPGDEIVAVPDYGVAEVALKERIEKQGITTLSATSLGKKYSHRELVSALEGDIDVAAAFATEQTCPVVVLGNATVTSEAGAPGTNLLKNTATVSLRIVRTQDGKLIENVGASAVVNGADALEAGELAVRDACAKIAGDATVAAVVACLGNQEQHFVGLTVEHPANQEVVDSLVTTLSSFPGIQSVERVFYSDTQALLRLDYDGTMSALAEAIASHAYSARTPTVKRVVDRTISISF